MLVGSSSDRPAKPEDLLDPRMLARLEKVDIRSTRMFPGKLQGERRSKKRGQSVEFDDYRNYVPGDDLRFIDWNVYARLDRLFIKLFLEEEDLCLHVVIDCSESHDCGNPNKFVNDGMGMEVRKNLGQVPEYGVYQPVFYVEKNLSISHAGTTITKVTCTNN